MSKSTDQQDGASGSGRRGNIEGTNALALIAAASAGLVLAVSFLAPGLPLAPLGAYIIAFVVVMGTTLAAARIAPTLERPALSLVVLSAVAMLVLLFIYGETVPSPLGAVAVTAILLFAGGAVGGTVGGRIEHAGHLLVVAVVSLLVDTFSVYHPAGPTAAVVAQPKALAVLALPWPMLGTEEIVPVLGVGDIVFAALYLSASRRHGLGLRRTTVAVALGLVVTMAAVIISGFPIPALVAMGLAVLIAHPEARKLPPKDRKKGRIILGALALIWILVWLRNCWMLSG